MQQRNIIKQISFINSNLLFLASLKLAKEIYIGVTVALIQLLFSLQ